MLQSQDPHCTPRRPMRTEEHSHQWQLFCTLCKLCAGEGQVSEANTLSPQSWQQILRMAETQHVLATLGHEISGGCYEVPDEAALPLLEATRDNTQRMLGAKGQAIKLAQALNQRDIVPLFLKGTALLLTPGQETLGRREQADIDLIVPPQQLEAAARTLLEKGYRFWNHHDLSEPRALTDDLATATTISRHHHHLLPLIPPSPGLAVELHRHPLPKNQRSSIHLADLFGTAEQLSESGANFLLPDQVHRLLHLVAGDFVHDGFKARAVFPIRAGCDFRVFSQKLDKNRDVDALLAQGGPDLLLLASLVREFMGGLAIAPQSPRHLAGHLRTMKRRMRSPTSAYLLDVRYRFGHLATAMRHSPGKLGSFYQRWRHQPRTS